VPLVFFRKNGLTAFEGLAIVTAEYSGQPIPAQGPHLCVLDVSGEARFCRRCLASVAPVAGLGRAVPRWRSRCRSPCRCIVTSAKRPDSLFRKAPPRVGAAGDRPGRLGGVGRQGPARPPEARDGRPLPLGGRAGPSPRRGPCGAGRRGGEARAGRVVAAAWGKREAAGRVACRLEGWRRVVAPSRSCDGARRSGWPCRRPAGGAWPVPESAGSAARA